MRLRLFTPGPTRIPDEVYAALSQAIIHHRQADFKEVFGRASENLKYLFQTKEEVITLTASGTGAMEASVANLLRTGDKAVFVNMGKFGERWGEILHRFGIPALELKVDWGKAAEPSAVQNLLSKNPAVKAVYLTHSETSTGTAIDLKGIADAVRACSDALIIVDGISSVGALELRMDEWGLDAVITGSQKGLMLPPGLSFIALSGRAWKAVRSSNLPRYYFDLEKALKGLASTQTPWTPAISLIVGLDVALQMIRREGLTNVWARHEKLARGLRSGCALLGFKTFSTSPSNAVTALVAPEAIEAEELRSLLREKHGIVVAGGQENLKGKIIRVAHLGYYNEQDILDVVSALGLTLKEWVVSGEIKNNKGENLRAIADVSGGVRATVEEFSKSRTFDFELRYP